VKRVFVCSPFRGNVAKNIALARAACRRIALAGDSPLAPHLLMPTYLHDGDPDERELGLLCGLAWLGAAHEVRVFGKPSEGMAREIETARRLGIAVTRTLR
jgi:hypothetical protein